MLPQSLDCYDSISLHCFIDVMCRSKVDTIFLKLQLTAHFLFYHWTLQADTVLQNLAQAPLELTTSCTAQNVAPAYGTDLVSLAPCIWLSKGQHNGACMYAMKQCTVTKYREACARDFHHLTHHQMKKYKTFTGMRIFRFSFRKKDLRLLLLCFC